MEIIFAKHIGFCSGVKRAVSIAEKSLKNDPKPIYFLGSLVHNEKVIEKFKKKNVKFVLNPKEAEAGTLVIQAHGFPPFPKKNNKLLIKDATCPLVKKAQILASSLYKNGYQVIIMGEKNHSETKGINGCIKNKAIIIENEKQAKELPKLEKIGIISQTTQGMEKFNKILKILSKKAGEIKWFNTICPEVCARQKELNEIIKMSDEVLVIGSRLSANTKRLAEKAKKLKKKTFWVNSLEELKHEELNNISKLGVVSGTSTPNWEIEKIKKYLKKYDPKKKN